VPDSELPNCSLHTFIASLYEIVLLEDIRFLMHPKTCAAICRLDSVE